MPITTTWTIPARPSSTTGTGRPSIDVTNTLSVIITGLWNDSNTWTESGKFWNDGGDTTGTTWITTR